MERDPRARASVPAERETPGRLGLHITSHQCRGRGHCAVTIERVRARCLDGDPLTLTLIDCNDWRGRHQGVASLGLTRLLQLKQLLHEFRRNLPGRFGIAGAGEDGNGRDVCQRGILILFPRGLKKRRSPGFNSVRVQEFFLGSSSTTRLQKHREREKSTMQLPQRKGRFDWKLNK